MKGVGESKKQYKRGDLNFPTTNYPKSKLKTNIKQLKIPKNIIIATIHPDVVLLYTRLYKAFFGLVTQPQSLGALKPRF